MLEVKLQHLLVALAAAAVLPPTIAIASSGGARPAGPPPVAVGTATSKDEVAYNLFVANFVSFYQHLADAIVQDKQDCARMAADINALISANSTLIAQGKAYQAQGRTLPPSAQSSIQTSNQQIAAALGARCSKDAGVKAATMRM